MYAISIKIIFIFYDKVVLTISVAIAIFTLKILFKTLDSPPLYYSYLLQNEIICQFFLKLFTN